MMGDQIFIQVSDGWTPATVWAHYRWWTSDADPWKNKTVGALALGAGSWYCVSGIAYFFADILNPYTGITSNMLALELKGLPKDAVGDPFEMGQRGAGTNRSFGGSIPFGPIRWEVLALY